MQRDQQWDLDKRITHIQSVVFEEIFLCNPEVTGSTQKALVSLFHLLQNSLFGMILKYYHNITLTTDNTKLGDMVGMLNDSTTTGGITRNSRTVPTETS